MLVQLGEKMFLVTGFFISKDSSKDNLSAIDIKTLERESLYFNDVSIIDGRFPPNFSMKRHIYHDGSVVFLFSINNEFVDKDFWDKYEDDDPETLKIYYNFLDSMTDLHGLPRIKHPEIPLQVDNLRLTEEEKRLKALEDELNGYLDLE